MFFSWYKLRAWATKKPSAHANAKRSLIRIERWIEGWEGNAQVPVNYSYVLKKVRFEELLLVASANNCFILIRNYFKILFKFSLWGHELRGKYSPKWCQTDPIYAETITNSMVSKDLESSLPKIMHNLQNTHLKEFF